MSAFDELQKKQERGEKLTSLEFAVWWCSDTVAAKEAADELADYELRIDLLAKGATWEHEENERLKEENADLCERVKKLERIEKIAREITVAVESGFILRLAKPCPHGNYATPPNNHPWFCDDCWIEMQNALAAIQDEAQ